MPKAVDSAVSFWAGRPAAPHGPYELIGKILGLDGQQFGSMAACRSVPRPEIFDGGSLEDVRVALGTCLGCSVRARCAEWAKREDVLMRKRHGSIQGGLDGVLGGIAWGKSAKFADD